MRVLVTGIGGDLGQAIARCCRRHGIEVVGADQETLHAWATGPFADAWFVRVPNAGDALYQSALIHLLAAREASLVIPGSMAEIEAICGNARDIPQVLTTPIGARRRLADKLQAYKWLCELGFEDQMARTWLPEQTVIKPRKGSGSRDVQIMPRVQAETGGVVVQSFVSGPEYTVAVWRSKIGETRAMAMNRELRGGATYRMWSKPEQAQTQGAAALGRAIAERTEVVGSINVQLRWTATGPKVFEVNPRFSSTASMRDSLSFSDVLWSIQEALGQPVSAWEGPQAGRSVRYWAERTQVKGEWR